LGQQLQDHRDPSKVRHSLTSQLRTLMIQQAQGWDDLSDTQLLGEDPVFQLACSDQRSTTPLTQQQPAPSAARFFCRLDPRQVHWPPPHNR
ncbi:MAG: transposase, partial [Thiopseudomonas sp.]|nr:transposase [Thiopseudomonas sp.]